MWEWDAARSLAGGARSFAAAASKGRAPFCLLEGSRLVTSWLASNGYRVDDAVHGELVHYLASQSRLKLKVRPHESLSWQFVAERASLGSDVSSSPTLCHDTERMADMRLSILVPPRAKLGCGICKGPEWKPGIFVQFAISAMKASGRLELVIREGAGTELVSPESSGYNSSASSAAGERSPAPVPHVPLAPPAALRRRLASVAEEAADRADSIDFDWKNLDIHNFDVDAPSDIEPDYDCPSIPNNPHTYESKSNIRNKNKKDIISSPSNRTIINLTEDGATIQCSYDNQSPRKNTFTAGQSNRENDKKTIVVEVHHTSTAPCGKSHCNYPPPMKKDMNFDSNSISSSTTLSSAIAEEIQKRKLNKKKSNPESSLPLSLVKKASLPITVDDGKKKQHDALMDEFKKVHRKMFAGQDPNDTPKTENNLGADSLAQRYRSRRRLATPSPPPPAAPRRAPARARAELVQAEKENVPEDRKYQSKPLGSPAKNLRFFGDTDVDSDGPGAPPRGHGALRKTASASSGADEVDHALAGAAKSHSLTSLREDSPRTKHYYKRNLHNISEIQGKPPPAPASAPSPHERARSHSGSRARRARDTHDTRDNGRHPGPGARARPLPRRRVVRQLVEPAAAQHHQIVLHLRAVEPAPRPPPPPHPLHYTQRPRKTKPKEPFKKASSTKNLSEDRPAPATLQKKKSYSQSTLTRRPVNDRLTSSVTTLHRKPEKRDATLARNRDGKRSQSSEVLGSDARDRLSRSISMPRDENKKAGWFKLSNKKKQETTRVR
ncbi:hypothetical protein MSG28_013908 [Choristoneura fumiferana]|uniref:Uncharacterized protein n=1 Tax=Choristoneura fumiferana TaxID=7141 RepID=A0ACC0K9E6_CHOFU|nr:hypothetical protein MSG28_013908 [Choristoneura fumiferana]